MSVHDTPFANLPSGKIRRCCVDRLNSHSTTDIRRRAPGCLLWARSGLSTRAIRISAAILPRFELTPVPVAPKWIVPISVASKIALPHVLAGGPVALIVRRRFRRNSRRWLIEVLRRFLGTCRRRSDRDRCGRRHVGCWSWRDCGGSVLPGHAIALQVIACDTAGVVADLLWGIVR